MSCGMILNVQYTICNICILQLSYVQHILIYKTDVLIRKVKCSCGSVVEHCVSSAKGCGFNSQETHTDEQCIAWMHCKSLWIKASAKCIHVNVKIRYCDSRRILSPCEKLLQINKCSLYSLHFILINCVSCFVSFSRSLSVIMLCFSAKCLAQNRLD